MKSSNSINSIHPIAITLLNDFCTHAFACSSIIINEYDGCVSVNGTMLSLVLSSSCDFISILYYMNGMNDLMMS